MSTTANWPVDEDIDDVLAADFDGSLSGLGMEIGTASFNMSDALMALPNITTLKEEKFKENGDLSQSSENQLSVMGLGRTASIPTKKTRLSQNVDADVSSAIKRFCVNSDKEDGDSSQSSSCKHSSSVPDLRVTGSQSATPVAILSASLLSQMLHLCDSSSNANSNDISPSVKNYGFQYVLGAATSIATKLNEETMTYLNQGQPYEIKLKKLGDLTDVMGKTLKSVIRIGFQERRLQYMEKEQISQWQSERTGERILEIDIPLSYGVWDVLNDPNNIHMCEFLWDPTKETGIFVKVNCISTEFTPKKHGGEKGVPFRIQIETFLQSQDYSERMHVASCQIKVFKPKGADRKHKTDKEKMSRRRSVDQDKYRPSCDCTFFSECNPDSLYISPLTITASSATSNQNFSPTSNNVECGTSVSTLDQIPLTSANSTEAVDAAEVLCTRQLISPSPVPDIRLGGASCLPMKEESSSSFASNVIFHSAHDLLSSEASAAETTLWLQRNRFGSFVKVFSNFSGSDILKLSRDDFIQICGLADGIRLYNVVRSKAVRPRLTMYVCLPTEKDDVIPIFSAIYLENYIVSELKAKFALLLKIPNDIPNIFIIGPSAIHVIVTDEVLRNISNDSMFIVELHKDKANEVQGVLLKPYT